MDTTGDKMWKCIQNSSLASKLIDHTIEGSINDHHHIACNHLKQYKFRGILLAMHFPDFSCEITELINNYDISTEHFIIKRVSHNLNKKLLKYY